MERNQAADNLSPEGNLPEATNRADRARKIILCISLVVILTCNGYLWARNYINTLPRRPEGYKGFNVARTSVPKEDIQAGMPPKDGIPAILDPVFEEAEAASEWLSDSESVIGVMDKGVPKAYPLPILDWHELVNDKLNDKPFLISYCPLSGTAMIFERDLGDTPITFGVSGLIYHSSILMYDHQTESLWTQLSMQCVAGESLGKQLNWIPSTQMQWGAWREKYPDTLVLKRPPAIFGVSRFYDRSPYDKYAISDQMKFPVTEHRTELPQKSRVLGVLIAGAAKAYPLDPMKNWKVSDNIGGVDVVVEWEGSDLHAQVTGADGHEFPSVQAFWFAWQAFYPETELFEG